MAIKIYTQEEAIKKFGKRYVDFDPCFLIVGTKKELQNAVSVSVCVDGEQVPIGTSPTFPDNFDIGCGWSLDVESERGLNRIVVWKDEGPKPNRGFWSFGLYYD